MDRFLVIVAICSLGAVYAGVVRRDAPSPAQAMDSSKDLTDFASQIMAFASQYQPSQATASGNQPNTDPVNAAGAIVQNVFRSWFPNTGGENMNYDLSEAMRYMNRSNGIPEVDSTDTSSMTREQFLEHVQKQANSFSHILNSNMALWLDPNRVAKFLNLTNQYSDPSLTPEAEANLQKEYQNLMIDFQKNLHEKLNGQKLSTTPVDPVASTALLKSLQKQMADMAAMYNSELSKALKPEDVRGALTGNQMNDVAQSLGKAVMNIFQNIGQGQGPFNSTLHWDSNKYN